MRRTPRPRLTACVAAAAALAAVACSSGGAGSAVPASTAASMARAPTIPITTARPLATATTATTPTPTPATASRATAARSTTEASTSPPATATVPPPASTVAPAVFQGISMTSVPADVIVPTSPASLDKVTNPINGRRGGHRPLAAHCPMPVAGARGDCLPAMLDTLGFDVTSGTIAEQARRVERAVAVVQLDAGAPMTGQPDGALLEYLRPAADSSADPVAAEVRRIGSSAQGKPITAVRYGDGPRVVLVVGQTHGDEEAGLRVLLKARSLPLPDGITLWVVPTMNPDGLAADTRFLANGADPNRKAVTQPEQQAVYDFAVSIRPVLTVWYHQNYGWVGGSGASMGPAKRYQAATHLGALKHSGDCANNAFEWCPIDDAVASSSILVELPDVVTPADVQAHAAALLAVAAGG